MHPLKLLVAMLVLLLVANQYFGHYAYRGGRVYLNRFRQQLSGSSAVFLKSPILGLTPVGLRPPCMRPSIGCQVHAAIITGRLSKYA
jgi:hypothetical protein